MKHPSRPSSATSTTTSKATTSPTLPSSHTTIHTLPSFDPSPPTPGHPPAHWNNNPPTHFSNPWPSSQKLSLLSALSTRFSRSKPPFVPVPTTREELVKVRKPTWGRAETEDPHGTALKATWLGHASWLIEFPRQGSAERGVRILLDPLFSERTSPVTFLGPKRYTPPPCTIAELPEVDAVAISHNHYDHLDHAALVALFEKQKDRKPRVFCALRNREWFLSAGLGLREDEVTELDWWEGVRMVVEGVGEVEIVCTPCQHNSGRTGWDAGRALWCSWVFGECAGSGDGDVDGAGEEGVDAHTALATADAPTTLSSSPRKPKSLYFAGDTAYRHVPSDDPTPEEEASMPHCPAFKQIGSVFTSFSLALLPIGLMSPRSFMSSVHCSPEDSVCVHKDINAERSLGMHYGTVRGGISAQYEDVRVPPRRWREACEREGWKWRGEGQNDNGWEAGLCDVGETVVVR